MSYCYNHVTKEEGCEYLRDFSRELEKQFDKNPNRKSVTFDTNFIKNIWGAMMSLSWITPQKENEENKGEEMKMEKEEIKNPVLVKFTLDQIKELPLGTYIWVKPSAKKHGVEGCKYLEARDGLAVKLRDGEHNLWWPYVGYGTIWEAYGRTWTAYEVNENKKMSIPDCKSLEFRLNKWAEKIESNVEEISWGSLVDDLRAAAKELEKKDVVETEGVKEEVVKRKVLLLEDINVLLKHEEDVIRTIDLLEIKCNMLENGKKYYIVEDK